jgi:hypothetical protein
MSRAVDKFTTGDVASSTAPPVATLRRKCACGNRSSGSGTCAECEKKEEGATLRRAAATTSAEQFVSTAPAVVGDVLRGSGQPLDPATRSFFEPRFQRDFSGVRMYADAQAGASARAVNAAAYSVGNRIVLDSSHSDTQGSKRAGLLAHELAHVEQGPAASTSHATLRVGAANAPEESAADARAHDVMTGGGAATARAAGDANTVRRAPPQTVRSDLCEATRNGNPARIGDCSYKEPEHCATYERWISTFKLLKTFESRDTPGTSDSRFNVIGGEMADRDFDTPGDSPKPMARATRAFRPGERFIDHPTDDWVKNCLPQNLRATAYELPADCADIAMILRHVWLSAHKRTEQFGKWTLGSAAGKPEADSVHQMIVMEGTATVAGMVNPYTAPDGRLLRSYAELEPLLHPGDILVWAHFGKDDVTFQRGRTGGHTHTISSVFREDSGKIGNMTVLQGNQPIFEPQKTEIHDFLGKKPKPTFKELGDAPGRRIERQTAQQSGLVLDRLTDQNVKVGGAIVPVWVWDGNTLLVAAGPPRAAQRPKAASRAGKGPALRALTDWVAPLKAASASTFAGTFEAMLHELRATVEGGGVIPDADIAAVGAAAGTRAQKLDASAAKANAGAGVSTHLQFISAVIGEFRESRDLATSPHLDSAYDLLSNAYWTHLRKLEAAIARAAGATP